MTEQKEENKGKSLLLIVEKLLDTNYKIFEIIDARLSALEDQAELFETKKEGK